MAKGEEIPKTNPAEIEKLIEQIRATNLEPGAKEKIERLLRTVLALLELLQRQRDIQPHRRERPKTRRKMASPRRRTTVGRKHLVIKTRVRKASQARVERSRNGKGMDAAQPPITAARGSLNAGMKV
jgi:hypothetical protein